MCACHATSIVAVWVSARAKRVPWRVGLSDVTMNAIHEAVPLLRSLAWHGICPCSVAFRYNLETTAVARLPHLKSGDSQWEDDPLGMGDKALVSIRHSREDKNSNWVAPALLTKCMSALIIWGFRGKRLIHKNPRSR